MVVSDREGGDAEEAAGVADVRFVGVVERGLLVSAGVALGLCDVCVGGGGRDGYSMLYVRGVYHPHRRS